eukprot:12881984-Prorocentrum_lima.AAC.1
MGGTSAGSVSGASATRPVQEVDPMAVLTSVDVQWPSEEFKDNFHNASATSVDTNNKMWVTGS